MEGQLYIRVRGRVLGPYDLEKLQSLARRGQLSRMHELSADGAGWVRAANYPELFVGAQVEMPAVRFGAPEPAQASTAMSVGAGTAMPTAMAAPVAQPQSQQWYYTGGGGQHGPVDFSNLQLLAATGQVRPEDLVWAEGMPAWIPATQIPGLCRNSAGQGESFATEKDRLPDIVCKSACSSRPWAAFVVISIFTYAILELIGGMALLILGARWQSTLDVATGIFNLLWAFDWAIGGFLLNGYCSWLGKLQYSRTAPMLEKAHDALRSFWVYVAINLIVMLVLIGIVVIWLFAAGVTLPRF